MSKIKKLYLPLLVSAALYVGSGHASDDTDTRTASSESSSSSSSSNEYDAAESDAVFQEKLKGLLKVSTSKCLPHLMDKLEAAKIEQERFTGLIKLASPQRLPCMLNSIKTYVALEQERLIRLLNASEENSAWMLNELNTAINQVLERGPQTTESLESTPDPEKYPYRTSTGKLVSKEAYLMHTVKVNTTILTSNLSNPYTAHLMLRVSLEYLNSFGLKRRWNKED